MSVGMSAPTPLVLPSVLTPIVDKVIDARGMACPGPLMGLIGAIRAGTLGQTFEVISSDEGSKTDIPAWVAKAKQELLAVIPDGPAAHFIVRKVK